MLVLFQQVQYTKKPEDYTIFEGYEPDFLETKEVYGQTDHCKIIGLEPDTEYLGRVQVFNTAGRGPKGQWRVAETALNGKNLLQDGIYMNHTCMTNQGV